MSFLYQGAQNWPQCSRSSKQQMERNNNFSEAAGYIFVEAGCTGASLPCWHPMDFWSTWCPPGTPGPFLQSCIPAAGHQSVLEPVLVTPSQMQDFGFSFVVLPEAPIDQLLQLCHVSLHSSESSSAPNAPLSWVSSTHHWGASHPTTQGTDEAVEPYPLYYQQPRSVRLQLTDLQSQQSRQFSNHLVFHISPSWLQLRHLSCLE